MPMTALLMFNNYLYSSNDVYAFYGAFAAKRVIDGSFASATLLTSVCNVRKDGRFRLSEAFYTGFDYFNYHSLGPY